MEQIGYFLVSLLVTVLGLFIEYFFIKPLDEAKHERYTRNKVFSEKGKKARTASTQNQTKRKIDPGLEFKIRWLVSIISVFVFFGIYYLWLYPYLITQYFFNNNVSLLERLLLPPWVNLAMPITVILVSHIFGFVTKKSNLIKKQENISFFQFYYYLLGVTGMILALIGVIVGLVKDLLSGFFIIAIGIFI